MRGKDYNTGLRGVLFEAQHYRRMGSALWLYGWLVLRQTHQRESVGWVLGGAPISYREIEEETGFPCRTLEGWMRALRRQGYIETQAVPGGIIIRITKAKKFLPRAAGQAEGVRNAAEGLRGAAGGGTRNCVPDRSQIVENQQPAGRIGSSSVEESKAIPANIHRDLHTYPEMEQKPTHTRLQDRARPQNSKQTPSCLSENQNRPPEGPPLSRDEMRAYQRLLFTESQLRREIARQEREDAVRRELNVGSGPEVQRT